jgi:hypothetical protein
MDTSLSIIDKLGRLVAWPLIKLFHKNSPKIVMNGTYKDLDNVITIMNVGDNLGVIITQDIDNPVILPLFLATDDANKFSLIIGGTHVGTIVFQGSNKIKFISDDSDITMTYVGPINQSEYENIDWVIA